MISLKKNKPNVVKDALLELRRMRERLAGLEKKAGHLEEPIAVVGLGCRFPMGADSDAFWQTLLEGRNTVREIPRDRWNVDQYFDATPGTPGKSYVRSASFLDQVDLFDAAFFGISSREAHMMDPQQRLLLEVSWEALESAWIRPDTLSGSKTGVYIGSMTQDYAQYFLGDPEIMDIHTATGVADGVLAGRIAYQLGLHGPTLQLDTACSSSLASVHLACQSLRLSECDMALAGGVNLMLTPQLSIAECRAGMLAPDGCSKTFDADADGYGRGEGCGVVVLKRWSDAVANGDEIWAKIRGSAINHDGPSSGLTVPNESAQISVLREALKQAGASPEQVQYLETHGTGTSLGDPIEVSALHQVFGTKQRDAGNPLWIGAVKSSIGHQEGAAGIAGLIKLILSIRHGVIPPHKYCGQLNPHIPWKDVCVRLPQQPVDWSVADGTRMGGVSSFGFSGTNVHVVVEQANQPVEDATIKRSSENDRGKHVLILSAKTPEALRDLALQYVRLLDHTSQFEFADLCYSANTGRSLFRHRWTLIAEQAKEAADLLRDALKGKWGDRCMESEATDRKTTGVLFLLGDDPVAIDAEHHAFQVYRDAVDRCLALCESQVESRGHGESGLDSLPDSVRHFIQSYASMELMTSWGLSTDLMIGVGKGHAVMACLKEQVSLEDILPRLLEGKPWRDGNPSTQASREVPSTAHSDQILTALREQAGDLLHEVLVVPVGIREAMLSEWDASFSNADRLTLAGGTVGDPVRLAAFLFDRGMRLDWQGFDAGFGRRYRKLPTYPFQRERFWFDQVSHTSEVPTEGHPLLGPRKPAYAHQPNTLVWEPDLTAQGLEFLREHLHGTRAVLPVAVFLEIATAAAAEALDSATCQISKLTLFHPVFFEESKPLPMQISAQPQEDDTVLCQIHALVPRSGKEVWSLAAEAHLTSLPAAGETARLDWNPSDALAAPLPTDPHALAFGIMFFAASESALGENRYEMVLEAGKYADRHGFSSVWVPERHFTNMGCLYPNPAVLQSALARETRRLRLMAGSVVAPLHHPLRTVEDWSMVDNLSNGRVGISLASGWLPNDFSLAPDDYANRHEILRERIDQIRAIWRGEPFETQNGIGETVMLKVFPPPIQKELPLWYTAAGNPASFEHAGRKGAHLLTHLLNQDIEALGEKIALYRKAREESGFDPDAGVVTVMTHTFVDPDMDRVLSIAREPYCDYLKANVSLFSGLASSRNSTTDVSKLKGRELDEFAQYIFDRFHTERSFIGTPDSCLKLAANMREAGVNEVACLLDFGPDKDAVLESLKWASVLRERHTAEAASRPAEAKIASAQVPMEGMVSEKPEVLLARCGQSLEPARLYEALETFGVRFEGGLRQVDSLHIGDREAVASLKLPAGRTTGMDRFHLHPVLLDHAFQTLFATFYHHMQDPKLSGRMVPTGIQSIRVFAALDQPVWCHAKLTAFTPDRIEGDLDIINADGNILARISGYTIQQVGGGRQVAMEDPLDDMLYEIAWRPVNLPHQVRTDLVGQRWLIFSDQYGVGNHLVESLSSIGVTCLQVHLSETSDFSGSDQAHWCPDPSGDLQDVMAWAHRDAPVLDRIIYLSGCDVTQAESGDAASAEQHQSHLLQVPMKLIQSLLAGKKGNLTRLWLVTRGAQRVTAMDRGISVAQSPLWGFARTLLMEHPELWGGIVDLDADASPGIAGDDLFKALAVSQEEDRLAFRRRDLFVERMARQHPGRQTSREFVLRADKSYLITGGLGGMGLELAHWLHAQGASHLVLTGRSALPDRNEWNALPDTHPKYAVIQSLLKLEDKGAHVSTFACDASDRTHMEAIRTQLEFPVAGVFHAAGLWEDCAIRDLDNASMQAVLRPKVTGSWVLHEVFQEDSLDYFVLFSSFSSLLPARGQASYAAANAFLDALAVHRRLKGLPVQSINWGPWTDIGFARTDHGRKAHEVLERMGIERIRPDDGFKLLHRLMSLDLPVTGVIRLDWKKLAQSEPVLERAFFEEVAPRQSGAHASEGSSSQVAQEILNGAGAEAVEERLHKMVSEIMQQEVEELDAGTDLNHLGLDSLMAVEIKNRVQIEIGVDVPVVRFLDGVSIEQASQEIFELLQVDSLKQEPSSSGDEEYEEFTV